MEDVGEEQPNIALASPECSREHCNTFQAVMRHIDAAEIKEWQETDVQNCLDWALFASSNFPVWPLSPDLSLLISLS